MKSSSHEYDLSGVSWHKSSYSGGDGGNCLEVGSWQKSTYSDGSGGNCLEIGTSWRKSTHSGGDGGDCVEVGGIWRKSTHSGGSGGSCVEVADGHPDIVPVRDSKFPDRPALVFRTASWSTFLSDIKADSNAG
ncbi:DUF397 domain-containing protein [Streptomyces sp. NPDC056652]|uniref:DUF397 domain-containing protein n=1 Tax=Streptomyces sp. NPDC056652 TaxID=3345893 RepID=UPI00368F288B